MPTDRSSRATVLVTGGCGFIGSHLVRRLLADGYAVRVLDNFETGRRSNLDPLEGIQLIDGDVCSRAVDRTAVRGVSFVFHLAALPSVARSWKDPVKTLSTNAHATAVLVEEAEAAGVSAFIYSSSSSVYGDQDAELKSESLEPRPISPYGYSKLLGEKLALAHDRSDIGMRVVALRYFNVFGPRQDPDSPYSAVIPLFIKHAIAGTTATIDGDGGQSRDFTHVDNVVEANVRAAFSRAGGVALNIACGQAYSLNELVDSISEIAGKPLATKHGPGRPGDIRHSLADISLAKREIGYCAVVDFKTGLKRTFDEYAAT